jgi:hypothetical protein
MLSSYPAISQVIIFLISIFLAIILLILLAPFGLSLNLGKKESLVWGCIKLTWLSLTIIKREASPQSIEEFLASIGREKDGMDEKKEETKEEHGNHGNDENDGNGGNEDQDADGLRANATENAFQRLIRRLRMKSRERKGENPEERMREEREAKERSTAGENIIDASTDSSTDGGIDEKKESSGKPKKARRSPGIRSLIDAAPDLAELFGDLGRSISIKNFSGWLCFGLNDPAQTAIISGYIWFFASLFGVSLADLTIEPWFDGLRLEGKMDLEIRARLISPIWAGVKSLRRKEIRRLVREMLGWI